MRIELQDHRRYSERMPSDGNLQIPDEFGWPDRTSILHLQPKWVRFPFIDTQGITRSLDHDVHRGTSVHDCSGHLSSFDNNRNRWTTGVYCYRSFLRIGEEGWCRLWVLLW